MIVTRCPACQTAFRVKPEQLRAGSGRVRCGKCRTVFNALQSLIYRADPQPAAATAAPVPIPPFVVPPEHEAAAPPQPVENAMPSPGDAPAAGPFEDRVAVVEDEAQQSVAEPAPPEHESPPSAPDQQPVERAEPLPGDAPATNPPEDQAAAVEGETQQSVAGFPPPEQATPRTEESVDDVAAERPVDAPLPLAAETSGEALRAPLFGQKPSPGFSRTKAVGLTLAILVAVAGLAAQALYVFREDLAMRYPQWRPQLEQWCRSLGCEIPLPRQADLMALESSELQPDPERPGLLVLSATVRNRAPFVQAYPHLELTLTDTRDQPLLRRVFSPLDYLPQEADGHAGLAAHRDVSINLWLDPGETSAAGYRLYVFYP